MLALLLLIADDPMIAKARTLLSAERWCEPSARSTDITVCGMRRADRFRVPFVGYPDGDPRKESVMAERVRLLNRSTPVHDLGPFQVESGMAGVRVGTAGAGGLNTRKTAP